MLTNYGYSDASGNFFITIDTDKCDGCGDCINACPSDIFEVVGEDPNDPLREKPVAIVSDKKKMSLAEIYEEFWELIDDQNEEFQEYIIKDKRRDELKSKDLL